MDKETQPCQKTLFSIWVYFTYSHSCRLVMEKQFPTSRFSTHDVLNDSMRYDRAFGERLHQVIVLMYWGWKSVLLTQFVITHVIHGWVLLKDSLVTHIQLSVIYVPVISNALFIFVPENREEWRHFFCSEDQPKVGANGEFNYVLKRRHLPAGWTLAALCCVVKLPLHDSHRISQSDIAVENLFEE